MNYKEELIKQIELLLKAQSQALADQQFLTVDTLSKTIYGLLDTLENRGELK